MAESKEAKASGILGFPPSPSELPSPETWEEALKLEVQDVDGKNVTFKSLVEPDDEADTVLVVFIRHFWCGICQDFLRSLQPEVTPENLLDYHTKLIVIGCGAHTLIPTYREATATPFPIYANPTQSLYETLGMHRSLSASDKKPDYLQTGTVTMFFNALNHGVKSVWNGGKLWDAGDIKQNGGEWFIRNGKLAWCHRMQNTMNHTDRNDLLEMIKAKDADKSIKSEVQSETRNESTLNAA